jgi:DNA-binding NtrC family response regulator
LPADVLEVTFREARQHAMEAFERLYLLQQLRRFRGRITDVARHCAGRRSTFAS